MRSETTRLTTALGMVVGARARTAGAVGYGLWPALYLSAQRLTVGHEHWNRAATSLTGQPSSTTGRATLTRARGVKAALA